MNCRGFTLIELISVIVIVGILLIIAVPRIIDVITNSRLETMKDTAKLILNGADMKYLENTDLSQNGNLTCDEIAKIDSNEYSSCAIEYDSIRKTAVLTLRGISTGKFKNMVCRGTKLNISCYKIPINECQFGGELVQGAEFIDGQYTYRYKQKASSSSWTNITTNGWGVMLTDKTSTNPVTTKLCTKIADKPIVAMSYTFYSSKATTIDLSSFDTSNVITMQSMFSGSKTTSLDLNTFDTSKVTSMYSMFYNSSATVINGLNLFNTAKVTTMRSMFNLSKATTLDLSSFNTAKVTTMQNMFTKAKAATLDLSSFDTTKVTVTTDMFKEAVATVGYARTEADLDKYNASSNKPSTLNFILK